MGLWAQAETRNSEVLAYLNAENLSYEIVYHDTPDEQKDALAQGAVDVISSVSLPPIANSRIAAQFAPRPYYFASTKGNTDLVRTLDETIARVDQVDPNLQDTLYDTYFRVVNDAFVLSDSQKSVLNGMGTLRVLCAENAAPYAYSMEDAPSGMLVSILRDFAGKAGLDLEYTFCSDRESTREMLLSGDYDVFVGVHLTSGLCAQLGFINSAAVIQTTLAYAQSPTKSLPADERDITIALVRGLEEQISTAGYKAVVLCDDAEGCIQAVESGKADVAAADRASLEYYIYESGSSLVTSLIPGQTQNTDIAVSRACDTALLAAMNNDIYSISEEDLAAYLSTGNLHSDRFSLAAFTRRHPVQAAVIVASATAILAAVIFILLSRSAKERSAMQALHNTQLQEALSIDRETNAAKTTFLSNMSHDIRTPMNAVIGFSSLLAKEPDNSVKVREYTRKISAASNHLLGLINDILDISKIESGKMSLRQSVFSIDELMKSINVIIRPMAGEKRQSFQISMGDMPHELFVGDKNRLNQVLINLLSNAIKYTPMEGHIRFAVSDLGGSSSSFERIQFIVSDDGYGMTQEFQKIIFEPFTRAESSTVNKEVGTGRSRHHQKHHRPDGRHHRRGEPSGARDHLYRGPHRPPGRAGDGGRSPAAPGGGATLGASASSWWRTTRSTPMWPSSSWKRWAVWSPRRKTGRMPWSSLRARPPAGSTPSSWTCGCR